MPQTDPAWRSLIMSDTMDIKYAVSATFSSAKDLFKRIWKGEKSMATPTGNVSLRCLFMDLKWATQGQKFPFYFGRGSHWFLHWYVDCVVYGMSLIIL